VQKFDSEGRFLLKWGTGEIGSEQGRFYGPRDIVVTPFGEVLVTDTGNKRIQVFDESGTFKRSFGSEGTTPGQFREPVGLAVDREGRVYVADTWNERIQVFDAGMQPVAQYPVQGWSSRSINNKPYLAVGTDGDVYATIPESGAILRVKNGVVERIAVEGGPRLRLPVGIAFDSVGRLAVADAGGGVVVAYDLTPGEGLPGAAGDVPSRAE
jgi:sugar lactone lactonase YvrE